MNDSTERAAGVRPLVCFLGALLLAGCGSAAEPPVRPAPPGAVLTERAPTVDLVLMGTTDVHGRLYPFDYYSRTPTDHGLALLAPLIDSVRAANPGRALLFDSGDLLQGNPLPYVHTRLRPPGDTVAPHPVIHAMNVLRYDAAAIGNHEFNYGLQNLGRAIGDASFPFVTANVFRHGTAEHAYLPYVLLPHATEAGDTLLIGVTGMTPPGVHLWDRHNVAGILEFRDGAASMRAVVADMRTRGADLVVVLAHSGLEGRAGTSRSSYDTLATGIRPENVAGEMAREVPGIDVIFLGHSHVEIADTTINGVLLTQAKNWGGSLAVATVRMERRGPADWVAIGKHAEVLRPAAERADTAFLDSLRWAHERTVAYVKSVVGRSTAVFEGAEGRVRDTPLVDLINEVQRKVAGTQLSAAAVFTVNARIPQGPVTVADLAGVYLYDNTLKAIRVNGAQLKGFLEKSAEYYNGWPAPAGGSVTNFNVRGYNFDAVSGVDYTIDLRKPVGERIVSLTFQGKPVRPGDTFTMAVNNYRQSGGGGYSMIADAEVIYDRQEGIRELLIEEVQKRGTIRPQDYFRQNWRIVPAEAVTAAAREQRAETPPLRVSAAGAKRLRILFTNDFHGRLLPDRPSFARGREVGGAATLAAYFRAEAQGYDGPTVLLDGGDVVQGTPISNLTKGRSTVEYFNRVAYSAAAIGNHEFDWTVPVLRERIRQARFAWLGANIFVAGTDTAPSWAKATTMTTVDGIRIGVIGLATEHTPTVTMPRNVMGLEFRSLSAAIDRWVPRLRADGADFVVVVAHAGAICDRAGVCRGEIIDAAQETTHRPDLILAGHTHQVVNTRVNGIPIVEAGSYGTRYAVLDVERVSADSVSVWVRGIPTTFGDRVVADSAVAALVARYLREIGPQVDRVVARMAAPLAGGSGDFPLGRLIADAQRAMAEAQLGFMNNGGIRSGIDAGPATWGELYQIQPFQNLLVRLTMTGAQVKRAAETVVTRGSPSANISGFTMEYDPSRPVGERVTWLRLPDGQPIRDDATYTVAVTDFLAERGDDYTVFGEAQRREDLGIVDLDALIDYLRTRPQPIEAPQDQRIFRTDGS